MAVAPEVLEGAEEGEAAATRAPRPSSSGGDWLNTGRAAYSHVSSPSAAAGTITKLIWAAALGLIALEIAAQATGQTWSLALGKGVQAQPPPKGAYQPLYAGQTSMALPSAMPGVFSGPVPVQGPDTNLSGRVGGNLAMP